MNYLYNGIELPELPEWDKTVYPYAIIYFSLQTWWLNLLEIRPYISYDDLGLGGECFAVSQDTYCVVYKVKDGAWQLNNESSLHYGGQDYRMYKDSAQTSATARFWANCDMYTEDGTLYLATSDPVPVIQRNTSAMLLGYQVGQAIRRMRGQKKPVAFLYNGVRLPPLPEWDKEAYPYAVIAYGTIEGGKYSASFVVADQPLFVADGSNIRAIYCEKPVSFINFFAVNDDNQAVLPATHWNDGSSNTRDYTSDLAEVGVSAYLVVTIKSTMAFVIDYDTDTLWANHDVYNLATGELYCAKSADPIPVYE